MKRQLGPMVVTLALALVSVLRGEASADVARDELARRDDYADAPLGLVAQETRMPEPDDPVVGRSPRLWLEVTAGFAMGGTLPFVSSQAEVFGALVLGGTFDDMLVPKLTRTIRTSASEERAEEASDAQEKEAAREAEAKREAVVHRRRDGELVRGAIAAARRAAGLDRAAEKADDVATRARVSGLVPELRVRVAREVQEGSALAPTEYDPERVTQSGGTRLWFEGRATFRLDRLVFADEEIALLKLANDRAKLEQNLVEDVLRTFERFQRARGKLGDPLVDELTRIEAELDLTVAQAKLDALTGGWFSEALAGEMLTQATAPSEPSAQTK